MPTLRLTQLALADDRYQIELALEGDGPRIAASAAFALSVTPQEQEHLRWYLEDYAKTASQPDGDLAKRIEHRMHELGTDLFAKIFLADDETKEIWNAVKRQLPATRLEISTTVREATALPWELLRDPHADAALALQTNVFVRSQQPIVKRPTLSPPGVGPIRVLLVICRPDLGDDVPFRSVATRLMKLLHEYDDFALTVLRPPTFEQLGRELRQAHQAAQPFHAVHFDGHGIYDTRPAIRQSFNAQLYADDRPGKHGYLAFEDPANPGNVNAVDGPALGKLLVDTGVPVLILNACRSAHAEPPAQPDDVANPAAPPAPDADAPPAATPHEQVRALGSLAQEVMNAGVAGVVAMRYNVYVVTAMQFVAEVYQGLVQGWTLGEAASAGRKNLADQPQRQITSGRSVELQDWLVPVIYEAAPIQLFPKREQAAPLTLSLTPAASPRLGNLPSNLPAAPDLGFVGRDETLLALDRALDKQAIVLLHALAGNGKSTAVAEFARWYALTGGTTKVIWTQFSDLLTPLSRVLDAIETSFAAELQFNGIAWLTLQPEQRRNVALQLLQKVPTLWIWDNVEPIAGFPAGTPSAWSAAEQRELADFLRAARATKAKFILTSRRPERPWLGDLPCRIAMRPMNSDDRIKLLRELASRHELTIHDIEPWQPLLAFSLGNPLTLTIVIGQALRSNFTDKQRIAQFVKQLRSGEAQLDDEQQADTDEQEGRSRSLNLSLTYGFKANFSDEERAQLALLHLFQGFVNVDALRLMGYPDDEWCVSSVRGLTREAGIALLNRAAEIGLLTAHGNGRYAIHPALPWYFRALFEQHYPSVPGIEPNVAFSPALQATRAFVEAMGELGNLYHNQYINGNREIIDLMRAEEANLLHARQFAIKHGWYTALISTMQGVRQLYDHTGRHVAWVRLVEELVPLFVDTTTEMPLAGREDQWGMLTEYRVSIAEQSRDWQQVEHIQRLKVVWDRDHATQALNLALDTLDGQQRNRIRTLAVSLHEMGHILLKQDQAECVAFYEESYQLSHLIGDQVGAANGAFNLGSVYKDILAIRDLDAAERWYQQSLTLHTAQDTLGRGQCKGGLGSVALKRFNEAHKQQPPDEAMLQRHLDTALVLYNEQLNLTPPNAIGSLAIVHNQIGTIYGKAGNLKHAFQHLREAAHYFKATDNFYDMAQSLFNIALAFARHGQFENALPYAEEALRNYAIYGARAAAEVEQTQQLITDLKRALATQQNSPPPATQP